MVMAENTIYKATYSGVPVYEFLCKNVACMRRRSDGWLNATQILKVAGFDKPQRTRILEREVQRGVHEKVQGGYGKYQGTWVPLDRGREIAILYKVEDLLDPIVNFRPATASPPLAPKHVTAASTKPRPPKAAPKLNTSAPKPKAPKVPKKVSQVSHISDHEEDDMEQSYRDGDMSDMEPLDSSMGGDSSPAVHLNNPMEMSGDEGLPFHHHQNMKASTKKRKRNTMLEGTPIPLDHRRRVAYSDELLDYFMTNENGLPPFLENPPMDFDVNEVIDDEGHTAFHWAAAMGDLTVVELLLKAGADVHLCNKRGETPLMRAVLFTNNYDRKSFPRLVTILRNTMDLVDAFDSTVFHHIAATTSSRNKILAAKYYCNVILLKLSETESQGDIGLLLDRKDFDGNTAVTIAARNSARKLVQMMLTYLASSEIHNNEGRNADDYILQYERQRRAAQYQQDSSSPVHTHDPNMHPQLQYIRNRPGSQPVASGLALKYAGGHLAVVPQPHVSEAAIQATHKSIPLMAEKLEALATAFDSELRDKEEDLMQARGLHESMQKEISFCRTEYEKLTESLGSDDILTAQIDAVRNQATEKAQLLKQSIERNQFYDLGKFVEEEEAKVKSTKSASGDKEQKEQFEAAKLLIKAQYGRNQLVEKIMELYAQAGVGTKMNDYRKLIAAALQVDDVDSLIPEILKNLETSGSPEMMAASVQEEQDTFV